MNPSFMAMQKGILKAAIDIMCGIPHVPKPKKNDGKLFAAKSGEKLVSAAEKEANTRAHLDNLAKEAKVRSDNWERGVGYPRSDLIVSMEEEQEKKKRRKHRSYGSEPDHVREALRRHDVQETKRKAMIDKLDLQIKHDRLSKHTAIDDDQTNQDEEDFHFMGVIK